MNVWDQINQISLENQGLEKTTGDEIEFTGDELR
jgi:hypothetical protein